MCGIGGWLSSKQVPRAQLERIAGLFVKGLAHRGPDDSGVYVEEDSGLALAHTRLAILDLSSAGHQPMKDATGRFTIVYNGEIYNFKELREELKAAGIHFRSRSDTEVLLELFARQGDRALPRLNGIFAFAVWDKIEKSLFLARDAMGVKPLYYTEKAWGFAFASELKVLVPLLMTRTLDPLSIHRYLTFLWCPGDGTPLREIRKLQPGEALVVQNSRIIRRWAWYELPARRAFVSNPLSGEKAIGAVTEGLRSAVHRQLVSDVPVGAFLSGGLDSSSVVAFAREKATGMRCFTMEVKDEQDAGFADDLPYARRVSKYLGVDLNIVTVDSANMARDLEKIVRLLGEPVADPAPLNVLYISRLACESGIKVLLSGTGGDDLFSGYRRHIALKYESIWSWLPKSVTLIFREALQKLESHSSFARRIRRLTEIALLDHQNRMSGYFSWMPEDILKSLYSTDFLRQLGNEPADGPMIEFLNGVCNRIDILDRMLALEQRFFLADHNLMYTDMMSMAVGVETRVPFLDLELVEIAFRIPANLKLKGLTTKWVLKKAMAPYLPKEVIYRSKTGFGVPLRRWLRQDLRNLVRHLLSPEVLSQRGLFNPEAVNRLVADDMAGRIDASYTILSLIMIELWCRVFLDERSTMENWIS